MLTANRTAAAARDPGLVAEPERDEQDVAGEPLQAPRPTSWASGGDRAEPRPAEHHEPGADASEGAAGLGERVVGPGEPRSRAARRAGAEDDRGEEHDHEQRHRRHRRDQQRLLVAAEDVDRAEHHRAEDDEREDVEQRLGDERAEHDRQVLPRPSGAAGDHERA